MGKFKVLLVYPNLMLVSTLPNNISQLSACLKEKGHDVKLFDATLYKTAEKSNDEIRVERMQVRPFNIKDQDIQLKEENLERDFAAMVDEYRPDLIGVTVVDDTVDMGLDLIKSAECKKKGIPVIFGGVHAIFNPDNLLQNDAVDMVCTGEGEETITSICSALQSDGDLQGISNLWYKDKTGTACKNATLSAPVDLDSLPMEDFTIFEEKRLYRPMQGKMLKTLPINLDRGCPYKCTFCAAPTFTEMYKANGEKYVRRKSTERIKKEIEFQLKRYNVEFLYFNSETFLATPLKKLQEFADFYSAYRIPFWCQTRIETITDEKVKLLKEMNCGRVSIGLEHGNEEFRKFLLKKTFTNKQVLDGFEILNKYEMKVSVNNMIGFPDETRELIFDTIKLNRQFKSDAVNGFIFQPYLGTDLHDYCIKKGYLKKYDVKKGTPIGSSTIEMPQISADELEGLLRTFTLYVKLPESYFPQIKVAEQLTEEGDAALTELRKILFEKYFDTGA